MSKNKTQVTNKGIGFTGLLTLLFIGLKLTGYISWSWFWVLSPIIFSVGLFLLIVLITLILAGIVYVKENK